MNPRKIFRWVYSVEIIDALKKTNELDGQCRYQGRRVITRDSPIDGGVFLTGNTRRKSEAIVVDSKKYPSLDKLYAIAKQKASIGGTVRRDKALTASYQTVFQNMRYDLDEVESLIRRLGCEDGGKIVLDSFIDNGIGVCRHQALTAGVLIEKFKRDGVLRGKVSVDRNRTDSSGHAWARYTSHSGDIMILDVAQRFFGSLESSFKLRNSWSYARPEDIEYLRKKGIFI